MRFREVGGRSLRGPALDEDSLTAADAEFHGEFVLDDVRIDGGEQPGAAGDGTVRGCLVSGVGLTGARLSHVDIADSRLTGLDLSNAAVELTTVRQTELLRCRGIGLRLAIGQANDLYLADCGLDYAEIEVTKVKGALVFHRCSFREAALVGNLSDVLFVDCDFTGAEFRATRAERCALTDSKLVGAHGFATLRGATLTRDQAVSIADVLATELGLTITD